MKNILVLGSTGRTGNFIIEELDTLNNVNVIAGVRSQDDVRRLPKTKKRLSISIIDITDKTSLQHSLLSVDIVINALRLRDSNLTSTLEPMALVELDIRLREATKDNLPILIISVGGAGSLNYPDKIQFWQKSMFPKKTLPRGKAQAQLRKYLEALPDNNYWSYLIPPPIYEVNGTRIGNYIRMSPSNDERTFLDRYISYQDFAIAIRDAISEGWTGTHLIGNC